MFHVDQLLAFLNIFTSHQSTLDSAGTGIFAKWSLQSLLPTLKWP